jgi:hypothetical protein
MYRENQLGNYVGGTRFFAARPANVQKAIPEPPIPETYHKVARAIPFYPAFATMIDLAKTLDLPMQTVKNAMSSLFIGRKYLIVSEQTRGFSRLKEDLSNVY